MLSFLKNFPLELTFLKVEREVVVSETMSRSLCEIVANSKFTLTDEKESSSGKRPIDPKKNKPRLLLKNVGLASASFENT